MHSKEHRLLPRASAQQLEGDTRSGKGYAKWEVFVKRSSQRRERGKGSKNRIRLNKETVIRSLRGEDP